MALVQAHIELAKAELSVIGGELGKLIGLVVGAIVLVLFAISLLILGGSLFLGEWLFGSMGWGILHGVLLFVALAIAFVLFGVGIAPRRIGGAFLWSFLVGLVAAIVFGLSLPNQAYAAIGDSAGLAIDPGVRPLAVGTALGALIGFLAGVVVGLKQHGFGPRLAALLGLTVVGAIVGAFTSITFGPQVGIALGIAAGYATWSILMGIDVSRTGVDVEALQQRFIPTQTIETSKETLEWLRRRMPPGIGS